ncbi:putative dipeptidyl-peptidase, partial [Operophtera brumata]
VLMPAKKNKTTFIIGFVAMLAVVGVAITLVVVLSGNEAGVAEPIVSTTEGTTTVIPPSPTPPVVTDAPPSQTTTSSPDEEPATDPPSSTPEEPLELEEIISPATIVKDIVTGNVTEISPLNLADDEPLLQNFVWGPSGNAFAFVYLNNIYYQTSLSSNPVQVTTTGQPNVIYHGIPDWEIFGTNNALWFSRDGAKLAYATFDDTNVRVMRVPHYGVPGSVNAQYTQHHEIRYPKPGTTNPTVSVTLRDLDTGVSTAYTAPTDIDQPILKTVSFVTNESIALMWSNRVQTMFRVVLCTHGQATCSQAVNGVLYKQIIQVTDSNAQMWLNQGRTNFPHTVAEILLWTSEDIIFNHKILRRPKRRVQERAVNGVLYKQIIQVTDSNAQMWLNQGRTNFPHTVAEILLWTSEDIINVECFTCDIRRPDGGECLYNEASISQDASTIALTCAGPDVPQVFIYASNGSLVRVWDDSANTVQLVNSRVLPTSVRLSVPLGVGLSDADVQLYGGPDTAQVTKQWSVSWESSLVSRWGIAVAQIDGRGSGLRGVDNMFAINRALGTVEIEDQITVTKYLQDTYSWLDANRTCIWGWSYGGYAASLALARGGDVFRCAAAVAPVVDWRFYDTIYTERYMDVPANNALGYAQSSLLTDDVHAMLISRLLQRRDVYFTQMVRVTSRSTAQLTTTCTIACHAHLAPAAAQRRLLHADGKSYFQIHGTADDNVHYQHAMLISRLLQRRDVYFTQMVRVTSRSTAQLTTTCTIACHAHLAPAAAQRRLLHADGKSYFQIHGTADDNVHYQHAMLISRLLQRRDVYFTQMVRVTSRSTAQLTTTCTIACHAHLAPAAAQRRLLHADGKSYFQIHGTADNNVHYQHAMLISRLLQRRDVYFTQMIHGTADDNVHYQHAMLISRLLQRKD